VDLPAPRLAQARGGAAFGRLYGVVSDALAEAAR
jgi:hypothetical protein